MSLHPAPYISGKVRWTYRHTNIFHVPKCLTSYVIWAISLAEEQDMDQTEQTRVATWLTGLWGKYCVPLGLCFSTIQLRESLFVILE